jgi:hypothetical protein
MVNLHLIPGKRYFNFHSIKKRKNLRKGCIFLELTAKKGGKFVGGSRFYVGGGAFFIKRNS